jgi:flagellar basal body-associated protein FliL
MRKKFIATAIAAVLMLGLFAGCGGGGGGSRDPAYTGENDIAYPLGGNFRINANTTGVEDEQLRRFNYVVCEITLEINDPDFIAILDERLYRVREIVIFTIAGKRIDHLTETYQKIELAEEIVEKINEEFNTTAVSRMVFSEFFFFRS